MISRGLSPSLRAALRIARREAWRSKWRSILVIALIGFPVFALASADIVYRTWQLNPAERIARELGAADAAVLPQCGPADQDPKAWLGGGATCTVGTTPTLADLRRALPAGSTVVPSLTPGDPIRITTDVGIEVSSVTAFDYGNPAVHGLVKQLEGRVPQAPGDVALTSSLSRATGLHVGDTMHTANPTRTYTVVGIVQDASHRHAMNVYELPSTAARDHVAVDAGVTYYVHTPHPVMWAQVRALNTDGFEVLSRYVYLNPPPASQVTYHESDSGGVGVRTIATASLVAGMALLEIVLLAGPAFAISAKRQRRDLALIAAAGGQRRQLRNVVLANGIVLGLAAGATALVGAIGLTAVGIPTLGSRVDQVPGHFDVRPLELLALVGVSTGTALLAALFPAVQAARIDVVAALAGRRGAVRTLRWVPIAGLVIAALGAAIAIVGANGSSGSNMILAGVAVTELGLIMCTPTLLGWFARLGRMLPLAPRIALRDAGRNRASAAPAVAAVMATMIGALAVTIGVSSAQDQSRRNYTPALPHHDAFVSVSSSVSGGPPPTITAIAEALRATLPTTNVVPIDQTRHACTDGVTTVCTETDVSVDDDGATTLSGRYRGSAFPYITADDGSGVDAIFGTSVPEARAALHAGRVVVPDASSVHDGMVTLAFSSMVLNDPSNATGDTALVRVPATVVDAGFAGAAAIIPPSVAQRAGGMELAGVLAEMTTAPTDHQLQAARGALQRLDSRLDLQVETGYHNPSQWKLYALVAVAAVIALGAAIISTALANVDGRDDLLTLGAVGASPRTRRVMSMSRAAVIAAIGTCIGAAAGFVPAYAWIRASRLPSTTIAYAPGAHPPAQLHMVVPWLFVVVGVVGLPLLAAALAGAFTRSRLPSERPAE